MPMIDCLRHQWNLADPHQLARDLAATLMGVEGVPDISMFRTNTAAFVHEPHAGAISDVNGDINYIRVQVLTNSGALDRDKQLATAEQLTALVVSASGDPTATDRVWVLLTEAPDGCWGLKGHGHTNAELVGAARAEIAALSSTPSDDKAT